MSHGRAANVHQYVNERENKELEASPGIEPGCADLQTKNSVLMALYPF
jgi:hypothetical protein